MILNVVKTITISLTQDGIDLPNLWMRVISLLLTVLSIRKHMKHLEQNNHDSVYQHMIENVALLPRPLKGG